MFEQERSAGQQTWRWASAGVVQTGGGVVARRSCRPGPFEMWIHSKMCQHERAPANWHSNSEAPACIYWSLFLISFCGRQSMTHTSLPLRYFLFTRSSPCFITFCLSLLPAQQRGKRGIRSAKIIPSDVFCYRKGVMSFAKRYMW